MYKLISSPAQGNGKQLMATHCDVTYNKKKCAKCSGDLRKGVDTPPKKVRQGMGRKVRLTESRE